MKSMQTGSGQSARRMSISNYPVILSFFKQLVLLVSFFYLILIFSSCHQHSEGKGITNVYSYFQKEDTLPKPKMQVKVNRKYDKQGNLISFDSTYVVSYSSLKGDTSATAWFKEREGTFQNFNTFYIPHSARELFFIDSLRIKDFMYRDFMKNHDAGDRLFLEMLQRMDSIRKRFYPEKDAGSNAL